MVKKLLPNKKYQYQLIDYRLKITNLSITSILNVDDFKNVTINESIINNYLNHQFNLLGSGWLTRNKKNNEVIALNIHLPISNKINSLIKKNYQLINWQNEPILDYDFDTKLSFDSQKIIVGADIKHPWELGRLQHLPRLAFFAINSTKQIELITEFKNQTLDFIANNPIGMGVQWACTMDVGIRVSNLLVAYDIFSQLDNTKILDTEFKSIFFDSIYLHGNFIFNHLEFKEGLTGNHYLFNLSGLLFAATYLNKTETTTKWLEFAQQEIEIEFLKQFFNDGGNFEGSTTYHCLSAEMMVYSTALMLRNNYNFNTEFISRLGKSAHFIDDLMKPNGEIPQFGDNDSGRYFKLSYINENNDENLLNYEALLASFQAILNNKEFENYSNKFPIEFNLIKHLSDNKTLKSVNKTIHHQEKLSSSTNLKYYKKHEIVFSKIDNLSNQLAFLNYPDFGISIFKTSNFHLAISHISNKKMHHSWGHVHNDKLAFDLFVNGKNIFEDAGSYCYTSNIEMRNKFRSSKAHNSILIQGVEQNNFIASKNGLFYLSHESNCEVLETTINSITLKAAYYGVEHIRSFEIFDNKLVITDYCNQPFEQNFDSTLSSRGYGNLISS